MTTLEVLSRYESQIQSMYDGYGTAESEARYEDGDLLRELQAELQQLCNTGVICGAELADEISEYKNVQYYINLKFIQG